MLAFDGDAAVEENQLLMPKAIAKVGTGLITFAARDSDFDGHRIKEGEILALENGKLAFTSRDMVAACTKLVRQLAHKDTSFVTIYYGTGITEEKAAEVESRCV